MNRSGKIGLLMGLGIGFVGLLLGLWLLRVTSLPKLSPPAAVAPDVSLFLSEQSISRLASATLQQPIVIDFEENGLMEITTRTEMQGLDPVVKLVMTVELQGSEVVSQLRWVELGFLIIPQRWLTPKMQNATTLIGQTINQQTPPDFMITNLSTTSEGVTIQLKWVGR
ncbi:MAG: hypothetical protein KDJ52_23485 [Anaerolineae bacterium]|nr:hypothetical protein [Anaerolineae bacterium]